MGTVETGKYAGLQLKTSQRCSIIGAASALFLILPSFGQGHSTYSMAKTLDYSDTNESPNYIARSNQMRPKVYTGLPPMLFDFYPMGGQLDENVVVGNFVDLDTGPGVLDWNCTNLTYDAHDASDAGIISFGEQSIGVPIFAVADGYVAQAHDGEDDMNTCPTCPPNPPANFVAVDHQNGVVTLYYHMKRNSVAVQPGELVRAGQQLGLVGSSGNSSGPHLHFATYYNGEVVEPWAGVCRFGDSWWSSQIAMNQQLVISDFGVSHEDFAQVPGLPYELPREGQIALSDPFISIWFTVQNLPANSDFRFRFLRPNGTLAYASNTSLFNNPFLRSGWYVYGYVVNDMHQITGTWRVLLEINGVNVVDAPVEVRTARTSDFNRPPEPIAIEFRPQNPTDSDVVFCNVSNSLTVDDLDYDIVRYEYIWTINDAEVRRVTSAARSDAIPIGLLAMGDKLSCTVTAGDGTANAAPETRSVWLDYTAPDIALTSAAPSAVSGPINVSVELSEPATDFTQNDVVLTNASIGGFGGAGSMYDFVLTPVTPGIFSAYVSAGSFSDAAGNANTSSNVLSRSYSPTEVWVDSGYSGIETGTQSQPYNMLSEGINAVALSGTLKIVGNSNEIIRITKALRMEAPVAPIRIGTSQSTRSLLDGVGRVPPAARKLKNGIHPTDPRRNTGANGVRERDGNTNATAEADHNDPNPNEAKSLPTMQRWSLFAMLVGVILAYFAGGRYRATRCRRDTGRQ